MREFFDAGVAPARGLILARARAVARWAKAVWLICLLASLLPSAYAQTTTRGFGSGTNQFTMDFVTIGNPSNPADTTGTPNPVGSVAYTYNLGKYEVSREQIDRANTAGGLGITMSDMSSYGGNGVNKPATGVTWHEAAKFVNWLNTSTGGTAAYKFVSGTLQPWSPTDAGYNASNLFRNSQAKYVIASRDEWYKGAYGSPNGTWYNYPTGSDSRPSAVAGGTDPNTAVYGGQAGPADINNAGGLSSYGTMGQGGNVWEWNETAHDGVYNTVGESLEMRGGSWDIGSDYLPASYRNYYVDPAIDGNNSYGFRVAVVSDFNSTINNGEVTITGYTGTGGVVEIPTMIGGLPVTTIGQNAFQSKSSVTAVVIPNGVTTIMDAAFAGCSGMTAITLPNSLTSIGGYVFDGCSSLQSITIPNGVISIGPNAFAWCTSLASITLPSGLKKIISGTFWACSNLTSITIPGGVDEIQYNAFLNCSKLASVYFLGNTPPTIGVNAFSGIASGAVGYYPATASVAWGSVTVAGLTVTPFGEVNRAPLILSRFAVGFNEDGTSTTGWTGVGANDTYGPDKPSFSNSVLVATATGSSSLGSAPLAAGTYTVQFAHGLPFPNTAPGTLTASAQAVDDGSSTPLSTLGTSEVITLRTDTTWTTDSFTFTIPNGDPAIGKYLKLTFNHSVENVWHGIDSVRVFISGPSTLGISGLTEDVTGNLLFSGTPFSDVDSSSLTVTLSVDVGTITGNAGTGITVGGTGTARTFAGTVADLNAYFITAGKITYLAPRDFNGSKTLGILVSDGELTANGSATINVQPGNDAPIVTGQSTTYDALAEFVAGPAPQSANSRWQYL